MKKSAALLIVIMCAFVAVSCKSDSREMSLEDFAKIQAEINLPDPDLNKDLVEQVTSKYGYSFDDYKNFSEKVDKDPDLKVKLGDIQLKSIKKEIKL